MKNKWRFDDKEMRYLKEVLESGYTSSTEGDMCKRFEKEYARKAGAKYAISSNSGTSTMHSCLAAAGIGPGDEVIVPGLTVISTPNSVVHQNAVPIFADINENTFNIDPKDIENKITERTKAIIPVALYGLSPDMDMIMKIAKKNDLFVCVDAAEAHLAEYKERSIASLGHCASFSLENSKHITCGEGGIVTTNDLELAGRVRKHGCHGYKTVTSEEGRVKLRKDDFQDPDFKRHDSLGWNYRMSEICAAVAMGQLEKIDHFVSLRRQIAQRYIEAIEETNCDFLTPQYTPKRYKNTYWTFAATFEPNKAGATWHKFRKKYIEFGGDGIYAAWSPTYLEPVYSEKNFYGKGWPDTDCLYKGKAEYRKGLCPVTERVQKKMMQFVNNYGSIDEAAPKIETLKKTINYFQK